MSTETNTSAADRNAIIVATRRSLLDSINRKNAMPASKGRDQVEGQIQRALTDLNRGAFRSAALRADEIACRLICMAA